LQQRVAKKDLTLTAYNHALQGIIGLKEMFAEDEDKTFEKQLDRNPAVRNFIPSYMQNDIPAFLRFSSDFWRFSYVYSVMERGSTLGLTEEERQGLRGEMLIWLQDIPGF